MTIENIRPDWPAPPWVHALTTTRTGGVSRSPFASLNLGDHVNDDPAAVARNRALLGAAAGLPGEPLWLSQVHGCEVCALDDPPPAAPPAADAACTDRPGRVCAILTADCLPVLLCDRAGSVVAAAHAGWRGLAGGVIEHTVAAMGGMGRMGRMGRAPADLLVWLGPAIGPAAFEVGEDVRGAFLAQDPGAAAAFAPSPQGRWLADLYTLARRRLAALGITAVSGGDCCTWSDPARFFSYRRDGQTGRMASLIWLADNAGAQ